MSSLALELSDESVALLSDVLLSDGLVADDDGEGMVELEPLLGAVELLGSVPLLGAVELGEDWVVVVVVLLELDDEEGVLDDDGELLSAVRHSVLRRVSVVELELVAESLSLVELGVFAALGVFSVEELDGVVCVVVDSATCVCSSTVRCCVSSPGVWDCAYALPAQLAEASTLMTAEARILDAWLRMTVLLTL